MRQIVINCYKFHGREDLLPAFSEDDDKNDHKDGQSAPKEKVKIRTVTHPNISVASMGGTLTTNVATFTTVGDPNSALAQTVNVCLLLF